MTQRFLRRIANSPGFTISFTFVLDRTPERLALAEAAIEAAFRLHPDSGEAHLARAEHLYRGYLDYAGALRELETARQTLPNDSRLFELEGLHRASPPKAIRKKRYAISGGRSISIHATFSFYTKPPSVIFLGRYAEEEAVLDRMLAISRTRH